MSKLRGSLRDWARRAAKGDTVIYFEGVTCNSPVCADAHQLERGEYVDLVQKKVGPFRFEYRAIRRSKKWIS